MSICAFTGYRPEKFLFGGNEAEPRCEQLKQKLFCEILRMTREGVSVFMSGMARGVDLWAAETVLQIQNVKPSQKIELWAIVPYNRQPLPWSAKERARYQRLLERAAHVRINGFEEADEASNGCFAVAVSENGTPSTVITFLEGNVAVGDTIRVAYRRRVNGASLATVKTNSTTARGALYAHWPVYSSGTDCTESTIKGWLHLYVPRVRVTALPGFDNSYKSAATNGVTFAAIDSKRADEKMYDIYYEPLDADGQIVTTATGDVKWN